MTTWDKTSPWLTTMCFLLAALGHVVGSNPVVFAGVLLLSVCVLYGRSARAWDYILLLLISIIVVRAIPLQSPLSIDHLILLYTLPALAMVPLTRNRQEHWNHVYQTKGTDDVSWYQRRPDLSLALIAASGVSKDAGIIDVGGGASTLVDFLLDDGCTRLAVLDLSGVALGYSHSRLGARASAVEWFEADVTSFTPPRRYGLWHDRAVFHFLTTVDDRRGYVATLRRTLQHGGAVVISTFALDGPPKCSGLDVVRYDEQSILAELGAEFRLQEVRRETHITPSQSEQRFIYFRLQWQT
jgi:2-polyprenyl-3-methyl-5-hydroxy-6-metoxy-1,4-benzoquinol methylase